MRFRITVKAKIYNCVLILLNSTGWNHELMIKVYLFDMKGFRLAYFSNFLSPGFRETSDTVYKVPCLGSFFDGRFSLWMVGLGFDCWMESIALGEIEWGEGFSRCQKKGKKSRVPREGRIFFFFLFTKNSFAWNYVTEKWKFINWNLFASQKNFFVEAVKIHPFITSSISTASKKPLSGKNDKR